MNIVGMLFERTRLATAVLLVVGAGVLAALGVATPWLTGAAIGAAAALALRQWRIWRGNA